MSQIARPVTKAPLKVYGVTWCGHCQNTKKNFDAAGVNYEFILAGNNPAIQSYPTLVCTTNGKRNVGEMSAAAARAWCPGA